jgi:hypothetical protein
MGTEFYVVTFSEFIDNHLANIMASGGILFARVTETNNYPRR